MKTTLTGHLCSSATATPYEDAVAHPFLVAAASGTLPTARLALYLFQDRIYAAQAYPRFIAQLITKIPLDDPSKTQLATRTLTVLVGCLTNIVREVAFFDTTARTYNLPLNHGYWRERKATRDYTAEMARIGTFVSLEDGLVFLWSMEKVYLDAWSAVYTKISTSSSAQTLEVESQADLTVKAIRELSYSWSSANPSFAHFVREIGDLVDDHFTPVMAGQPLDGRSAQDALAHAKATWDRVVELEADFWPNEGEEETLRMIKGTEV